MNAVTITLPIPHRALHPNARAHWAAKAGATKKARASAMARAHAASLGVKPRWKSAMLKSVWYFATRRSRDADGLVAWLKAYQDGIADAGIVANDCGIVPLPPEIGEVDRKNPRVVVTVTQR